MLGFWAVRKVAIEELIYDILLANNKNAKKDVPFICVTNQY